MLCSVIWPAFRTVQGCSIAWGDSFSDLKAPISAAAPLRAPLCSDAIAMLWVSYIVGTSAARRRVGEETARRLRCGSVLSDDI